jgi:hypothetical protein
MKKRPAPTPALEREASDHVIAQFVSADGAKTGSQLDLTLDFDEQQLQELLNAVLNQAEPLPYSFFINSEEFTGDLKSFLEKRAIERESVLRIVYQPQAVFRVRALTRCTSSLPGHTDAVLSVAFSPDGTLLASGSGDKTLRLWDLLTQTPIATCEGHTHWVLCIAWSPDARQVCLHAWAHERTGHAHAHICMHARTSAQDTHTHTHTHTYSCTSAQDTHTQTHMHARTHERTGHAHAHGRGRL